MPTKKEIISYVLKTPHNINPNVLSDMLDNITEEQPAEGLLSVTVTPPIESVDSSIKNYLPREYIEGGVNATTFEMSANEDANIERTITVVPGTDWICNVMIQDTPHYSSTPGEPFTYTAKIQDITINGLHIRACDPDNRLSRYVGINLVRPR